jgi:NAD(P)-dependent dehydrogenase (short-subunit alcohol dehydrogenase family)
MDMSKILVITGASRGIGAATARLAGAAGYSLCVNYRENAEAAARVVADVQAAGASAFAVAADVSVESDVMRLFETVDQTPGRLAGLVNNAGILETQMRLDSMSGARLHRVLAPMSLDRSCARERPSGGFRRSMAARAAPSSTSRPARPGSDRLASTSTMPPRKAPSIP